jgi:MYXO-CTERM domain-containing protein
VGIVTTRPVDLAGEPGYTDGFAGTSAAAPFVSGVAALALSANPELDALELRRILEDSAEPLATLANRIASGGRVNAANAVRMALDAGTEPTPVISGPAALSVGESGTFSAAGSSDPDGDALRHTWWLGDGEIAEGVTVRHAYQCGGIYPITLEVVDETGMRATTRSSINVAFDWVDTGLELESAHPYDASDTWLLDVPDAQLARLHFRRLELVTTDDDFVENDDAVVVFDAHGTPAWSRSAPGEDFWTGPLPVHDDVLELRLLGRTRGAWGYHVDRVQVVGAAEPLADCACSAPGDHTGRRHGLVLLVLALAGLRRRGRPPPPR